MVLWVGFWLGGVGFFMVIGAISRCGKGYVCLSDEGIGAMVVV